MLRLPTLLLGLAVAAVAGAHADSTVFQDLTWAHLDYDGYSRSVLSVSRTGEASLRRVLDPDYGQEFGAPPPVLRGRLSAAELQELDRALSASELSKVPTQTANYVGSTAVEADVRFADGRPPLRFNGSLHPFDKGQGFYGDFTPALRKVEVVLEALRDRIQASGTELHLEIERIDCPRTLHADQDLELELSGRGQPGVEFEAARAILDGRRLLLDVIGRQVAVGPATPWRTKLRIERPGRIGQGYLYVKRYGDSSGSIDVRIYQSLRPVDGRYFGKVVEHQGTFGLRIDAGPDEAPTFSLDDDAIERLCRFEGEYVRFSGVLDARGRLSIRKLLQPEQRSLEGFTLAKGNSAVEAAEIGRVLTFGPMARALTNATPSMRVSGDGWFFRETGFRKRTWANPSGAVYNGQRFYLERLRATVTADAKIKRDWATVGRVQPGDEVWVRGRRFFGWSYDVETLDGRLSGRMRSKRLDFEQPAGGAPAAGIVSGLSGQ